MKKKRAILLFGSIAVLMLGYGAWCGRSMYLSVPLPELVELPEEVREDARSLIVAHGMTRPDPFDVSGFVRLLAQPYDSAPQKWSVGIRAGSSIVIYSRRRLNYRPKEHPAIFTFTRGGWYYEGLTGDNTGESPRFLKKTSPSPP